jgi:hypothetical protein
MTVDDDDFREKSEVLEGLLFIYPEHETTQQSVEPKCCGYTASLHATAKLPYSALRRVRSGKEDERGAIKRVQSIH